MNFIQNFLCILALIVNADAMSCKYGGRAGCISSCMAQNCATGYCMTTPDQTCVCSGAWSLFAGCVRLLLCSLRRVEPQARSRGKSDHPPRSKFVVNRSSWSAYSLTLRLATDARRFDRNVHLNQAIVHNINDLFRCQKRKRGWMPRCAVNCIVEMWRIERQSKRLDRSWGSARRRLQGQRRTQLAKSDQAPEQT